MPGGDIEVITHDPSLDSVYYLISTSNGNPARHINRDNSECLSCHGTTCTESIPGVLMRSVFPDVKGQPLLAAGTYPTDHSSPIGERWGGYYVNGHSSLSHPGNRTYQESGERILPIESPGLTTLSNKIDVYRYLRPTSDIVALMVLEHQCQIHSQLVAASMNYRRIYWLQKSLDPEADPDVGTAGKNVDESARRIADLLLFKNEAELGEDGIEGDPAFQEAFTKRFPKSNYGRSLADFQLNDRLFKHRCSYMVYSKTLVSLPPRVKSAVIDRLHTILESEPEPGNHPNIKTTERRKISSILEQTLPAWKNTPH